MKKNIILLGLLFSMLSINGQEPEDPYTYRGPYAEVVNPVNDYRSFIRGIRDWEDIRTITGSDSLGPTVARYFILEDEIKYIDYYHVGKRQYVQDRYYLKGKQLIAATSDSYYYLEDIPWQTLPDIWDYPNYGISEDLIIENIFVVTYYSNGEAVHQLASDDCPGILMDEYLDDVQELEAAELKKLLGLFRMY